MSEVNADVVERVAAVQRRHIWYFVGNRGYKCNCGWSTGDPDEPGFEDPHAHVATAVLATLQLTEQWGAFYDDGTLADDIADDREHAEEIAAERCRSCDSCRGAAPKHVETRLVGPWVRA